MPEEAERPEWLDDEFLKTCIRNSRCLSSDSDIHLLDVVMSYVVAKGENYMSIMYRAEAKYQLEGGQVFKEPFIVKVCHENEQLEKSSKLLSERERVMYVNLVPKLEKLFEEKGLKTQFVCRYFHGIENPKLLVLEDLKPLGFVIADRVLGMDLEHCKAVYSKIAQFHAAGMCHFYSQPDSVKYDYAKSGFDFFFENNLSNLDTQIPKLDSNVAEMETHNDRYKKALDFFAQHRKLLDKNPFPQTPYVPDSKFNSINHTDFWVNNMMFKYDQDGKVSDLFLVYLQASHYTTVAFDFLFFFFSSPTLEVRKNNYHELKKHYFDSLVTTLRQLDYKGDIPTTQEFEEELKRSTMTVLFCLLIMLPLIVQKLDQTMTSRKDSDVFSSDEMAEMALKSHNDRNYLDKMLASVDILQDNGFMDKPPEQLCCF